MSSSNLTLAPASCIMGHDWHAVKSIGVNGPLPGQVVVVRTRLEQDPIICARCGMLSLKASTPRPEESS